VLLARCLMKLTDTIELVLKSKGDSRVLSVTPDVNRLRPILPGRCRANQRGSARVVLAQNSADAVQCIDIRHSIKLRSVPLVRGSNSRRLPPTSTALAGPGGNHRRFARSLATVQMVGVQDGRFSIAYQTTGGLYFKRLFCGFVRSGWPLLGVINVRTV
jgi:hypothetical protein